MISGSGDPITYNCDGITTEFPITADLGLSDDTAVQVFHTDSAGIETKWSKGTEYSVVAGNVVTAAIYPATDKITIAPELNDQQLLDLIDGDPLDPDNLEGSLDKLAARIREIATHVLRALRLPLTSDAVDSLGTPTVRKGGFPHFNDTTGDLEVVNVIGEGEIISTAMRPVVEAATLGAARTAMDVAEADAGVPTGGTDEQSLVKDGATALATKWKSLKTTETVSTATATIAAPNRDHTVFSDTATLIGAIALTITDATNENARLTIVNLGAFDTTLTMTGLTGETVPGGEARAYVWNGTGYTLASGGGGGGGTDLAEIQVPQPKTWVDKGITPGVSITNQWGLGSFVLECEISGIGAGIYTSRIEVEDLAVSAFSNFFTSNGTNNADAKVIYNGSSGAFELTATVSSVAVAINRIQFYEDDPDNLPLQTIPSDPSLIKDWVEKWNDGGAGNVTSKLNEWGTGIYSIQIINTYLAQIEEQTLVIEVTDLGQSVSGAYSGAASTSVIFGYEETTGAFQRILGAYNFIKSIKRWEDVAGADAQMSVPVDGWEQKFYDYSNTSDVVNAWGDGDYKIILRETGNGESVTCIVKVNSAESTITVSNTSTAARGSGAKVDWVRASNSFVASQVSGTYYIAEIHKFNSLVNVLHSYVPDPRSVAQKDWVSIGPIPLAASSTYTQKVPNGKYLVTFRNASVNDFLATYLTVDNSGATCVAPYATTLQMIYTTATGLWNSGTANYHVHSIFRWEDSQASDAPRTVLDDGYETIYENFSNTAQTVTESVDNGTYVVLLHHDGGTTFYTGTVVVNNSDVQCNGVWDPALLLLYTTATGVWDSTSSGHSIVQIRKQTGLLRIYSQVVTNTSEGSNITNAVIDTDAGDVDCTSYFTDTTQDRVVKLTNDGTNGNHLTNCPNGIEIGDGKTVQFYYNLGWRYEDVCIDEYTGATNITNATGTYRLFKYSGGRMVYMAINTLTGTTSHTETYPEAFTVVDSILGTSGASGSIAVYSYNRGTTTLSTHNFVVRDAGNNPLNVPADTRVEGRWKTGV